MDLDELTHKAKCLDRAYAVVMEWQDGAKAINTTRLADLLFGEADAPSWPDSAFFDDPLDLPASEDDARQEKNAALGRFVRDQIITERDGWVLPGLKIYGAPSLETLDDVIKQEGP